MDELFSKNFNVRKYYNDRQVIEQTAAQLIKDFSEFSFEITFTGKKATPYEELFTQVEPVIAGLMEKNYSTLRSLLYRIDVSEKEIQKHRNEFSELNLSEIITDLILRRELKKVVTRNYFKS